MTYNHMSTSESVNKRVKTFKFLHPKFCHIHALRATAISMDTHCLSMYVLSMISQCPLFSTSSMNTDLVFLQKAHLLLHQCIFRSALKYTYLSTYQYSKLCNCAHNSCPLSKSHTFRTPSMRACSLPHTFRFLSCSLHIFTALSLSKCSLPHMFQASLRTLPEQSFAASHAGNTNCTEEQHISVSWGYLVIFINDEKTLTQ